MFKRIAFQTQVVVNGTPQHQHVKQRVLMEQAMEIILLYQLIVTNLHNKLHVQQITHVHGLIQNV